MKNQKNSKKSVLIITYLFPPFGGPSVFRVLKFVRYLPFFNWRPLVITASYPFFQAKDESLLNEIPHQAKIFRIFNIDLRNIKILRKFWAQQVKIENIVETEKQSIFKKFLKNLKLLIFLPDESNLWLPFLIFYGFFIILKNKPQIIFVTAPPYSPLFAGIILKKIFKIPLVADFRDPWSKIPEGHFAYSFPLWRKKIDSLLEKWVLKNVDKVIVVSEKTARDFSEIVDSQKIEVIHNGYDEEDFQGLEEEKIFPQKFKIVYSGSFFGHYNPFNFLRALKMIIDKKPEIKKDLKIEFYGRQIHGPGIEEKSFQILKNKEIIKFFDYLPHKEILKKFYEASLLLLVIGRHKGAEGVYSTKIFEYIRVGKPIILLSDKESLSAKLIERTKTGIVVDPENVDEIAQKIEEIYEKWKKREKIVEPNWEEIKKYERKKLTGRLAEVFDELLKTKSQNNKTKND